MTPKRAIAPLVLLIESTLLAYAAYFAFRLATWAKEGAVAGGLDWWLTALGRLVFILVMAGVLAALYHYVNRRLVDWLAIANRRLPGAIAIGVFTLILAAGLAGSAYFLIVRPAA